MEITPHLIGRFFPDLQFAEWGYLDFNEIAAELQSLLKLGDNDPNPFLDPDSLDKWFAFVYKLKEIEYSWGGWLEDRSSLWRGHYHKPGECIHLGVDINVPENTPVLMPTWGKLVHSYQDNDQQGGWGGKVIFEVKDQHYMVLGHLKNIPGDLGTKYSPGEPIGRVAEQALNGGWSPHLHVQVMRNFVPDVDGYGPMYEGIELDFPDPMEFL